MGISYVIAIQGVSLVILLGIFWRISQFTSRASFVLDTLWDEFCREHGMTNTMPKFSKSADTMLDRGM